MKALHLIGLEGIGHHRGKKQQGNRLKKKKEQVICIFADSNDLYFYQLVIKRANDGLKHDTQLQKFKRKKYENDFLSIFESLYIVHH